MPRIARGEARVRLNLEMNEQVRQKLESLRERTQADSLTEVIRRALAVYEYLWEEKGAGSQLVVRETDGQETRLKLL